MSDANWGSDVPVSMPEIIDPNEILIDFGTHVFTANGMRLKVSAESIVEIVATSYHPVSQGDDPR